MEVAGQADTVFGYIGIAFMLMSLLSVVRVINWSSAFLISAVTCTMFSSLLIATAANKGFATQPTLMALLLFALAVAIAVLGDVQYRKEQQERADEERSRNLPRGLRNA